MRLSTNKVDSASETPAKLNNSCDECGLPNTGKVEVVLGFGAFHPECVAPCPDGWAWPISLIETGEVSYYCGGCALAAGRDEIA